MSSDPVNGGRADHFAVDQPTFSPKLMVFCGMKRDGTFCLKFFRNENVTGASYHRLLQFHALPQLRAWNGGNLDGVFWQQDGRRGFFFRKVAFTIHNSPEPPPTNKKSAKWSESSSDKTMTSPATKKNFKIGPLGGFEKMRVLYVAMAGEVIVLSELLSDHLALFYFRGVVKDCCGPI